jgi:hypothetical protein
LFCKLDEPVEECVLTSQKCILISQKCILVCQKCILVSQKRTLPQYVVNKHLIAIIHAALDHSSPASLIFLPEGNVDRVGKGRWERGLRWCRRGDQTQERTNLWHAMQMAS